MAGHPMNILTSFGRQQNFGSWLRPITSAIATPAVETAQLHMAKLQGVVRARMLPQFDSDRFTKDPQAFDQWKRDARSAMTPVVSFNVGRVAHELRYPDTDALDIPEKSDVILARNGLSVLDIARAGAINLIAQQSMTNFLGAVEAKAHASFETSSKTATWGEQVGSLGLHVGLDEYGERERRAGVVNAFDATAARGGLLPVTSADEKPSENALVGMRVLREAICHGSLSGEQRELAMAFVKDHNPAFTRMMGRLDSEGQAWYVSQFVSSFMHGGDTEMAYQLLSFADDMGQTVQI